MNKNLIGICGLYCGACDNYLAFQDEGKHLLQWEKYENTDHSKLKCSGCNSDNLSEHCSKCEMMKCAKNKGYLYCGECFDYPCKLTNEFLEGGKKWELAKHRNDILKNSKRINEIGVENWLKESANRWTCECGHSFSFYEKICSNCNKDLDSYSK